MRSLPHLTHNISSLTNIHSIVYSLHNTVWVEQQSFNFTTDTSYLNTYIYERKQKRKAKKWQKNKGKQFSHDNFNSFFSISFSFMCAFILFFSVRA
jgi:hypothetical protein